MSRYIHRKNKHVIAFEIYSKGNNQCAKRKEDTYIMDVGQFSRAYVAQKQIDYKLQGNKYGNPGSMDYLECTLVQYNDAYVSLWERWHSRMIHPLSTAFFADQRILSLSNIFETYVSTMPNLDALPQVV
jgi:hypothetical protein